MNYYDYSSNAPIEAGSLKFDRRYQPICQQINNVLTYGIVDMHADRVIERYYDKDSRNSSLARLNENAERPSWKKRISGALDKAKTFFYTVALVIMWTMVVSCVALLCYCLYAMFPVLIHDLIHDLIHA